MFKIQFGMAAYENTYTYKILNLMSGNVKDKLKSNLHKFLLFPNR